MFSLLKTRLVRLALAGSLTLPVLGGVNVLEAHASCFYGGYSDTVSGSYAGTQWSSTVWYTVGYNCSGYPESLYVSHFQDRATFLSGYHASLEAWECNPWQLYGMYCNYVWDDYSTRSCNNGSYRCTITRDEYPNRWVDYTYGAATASYWIYFGSYGGDWHCNMIHSFLQHHVDLNNVCFGGA